MNNLLTDAWLPFRLRDGSTSVLPLSAVVRDDVIDVDLPREDFTSAAYQLLIAILQTIMAPQDDIEWGDRFHQPPTEAELSERFLLIEHAFSMNEPAPLFMQDFDPLDHAKPITIAGLLIDAPGENTIKLNTDHFVKRGVGDVMSPAMAVLALWTLQVNAPAGGAGHRVGLRGGGPLTVLVIPDSLEASFWQKLWLNVINREVWVYEDPDFHSSKVFPWLSSTRDSKNKGTEVYRHHVHPLQMYWSMPRRIRLIIENVAAVCVISGVSCEQSVRYYRTQNYGINYSGNWDHPLTPYRWDPRKVDAEQLSLKGQSGGLSYKVWDALTLSSNQFGQRCSRNVEHYSRVRDELESDSALIPRLWVSGYDMDNMKARGWHSVHMPLFAVSAAYQDQALRTVRELQELANSILRHCRNGVKAAWFERPADAKGDLSFLDVRFWQRSESAFFLAVRQIFTDKNYCLTSQAARRWLLTLRRISREIFDEYAFTDLGNVRSMRKRVTARHHLIGWLHRGKEIRTFIEIYQIEQQTQLEGTSNG